MMEIGNHKKRLRFYVSFPEVWDRVPIVPRPYSVPICRRASMMS